MGPTRPRKGLPALFALALTAMAGAGAVRGQVSLPDIGDASGAALSAADERRLGEAFMREIRSQVEVIDEPEVATYVQSLGHRLASHSEAPGQPFTFFVVSDPAINAFAAPGGYIGVNSGLILTSENEGELAAVLAHEIAHITQRHIARSIHMAGNTTLPALAGILAAILIGTQNSQAGAATAAAVTAGQVQMAIDFTRANEQEADRVGIQTLAGAGFDPRAMPAFFERLQQSYRYYGEPPEFLSTHPVTGTRIADSLSRAEQHPYRQHRSGDAYYYVKARLRVKAAKEPQEAVRYFEAALGEDKHDHPQAARYGYALALLRAGEPKRARAQLAKLVRASPDSVSLSATAAEIELATGRVEEALSIYADVWSLYPGHKLLVRGYAQALLRAGQPKDALRRIDEYGRAHPLDAALYRLAAEAHQRTGDALASSLALAEHHYLDGRLEEAIIQLKKASRSRRQDYYRSSQVEARLRQLEDEKTLREDK